MYFSSSTYKLSDVELTPTLFLVTPTIFRDAAAIGYRDDFDFRNEKKCELVPKMRYFVPSCNLLNLRN